MNKDALKDSIFLQTDILREYLEEYTKKVNCLQSFWAGEDYLITRDALLSAGDEIREITGISDIGGSLEDSFDSEAVFHELCGNIII